MNWLLFSFQEDQLWTSIIIFPVFLNQLTFLYVFYVGVGVGVSAGAGAVAGAGERIAKAVGANFTAYMLTVNSGEVIYSFPFQCLYPEVKL